MTKTVKYQKVITTIKQILIGRPTINHFLSYCDDGFAIVRYLPQQRSGMVLA